MANTRMSAKNSFQEGLILDISPENMSATSMSSALNATLLTFNGNEMVLQNDMGNGRVETAFLPEGYVPVGTCEFGDIIYIVSYNPLINKSQIGCFPSPERNISTEELGGLGQSLQSSDFQEMNGGSPTGKLKATSVKKILYDNRDMTPGDKYIIYSEDLDSNNTNLSDYGNTSHTHETFPKLVKIHVVSIEESGKIVYLDSTTRWYDNDYYLSNKGKKDNGKVDLDSYRDLLSSGYSVFSSKVSGKLALLVELEKITGFSCAWEAYSLNEEESDNTDYSIYMHYNWTTEHNDVNPDGVALLISEWSEINGTRGQYQKWSNTDKKFTLNQPINIGINLPQSSNTQRYNNGFTRHYSQESNISYSTYESIKYDKRIETYQNAYKLNINKTLGGIPIPGEYYINCTKLYEGSYYSGTNRIYPNSIDDSIVNNYFHYPIIKHFGDFTIPTKQTFNVDGEKIVKYPNINNLIYHYKIAPTMPYGILEEYAQEGYIDFSKLGKRHINLNTWKYYNYENTSTLTWGMEAYTEPNKGIQEIVFEFYDNNGFVAAYHTKDKLSYNGVFTEYLTLNESGTNYKLNNIKAFDSEPTYHKGLEVTKETAVPGFKYQHKNGGNWIDFDELREGDYYMDDSGTLYSNCLYLVKIVIKYCNKNVLDEYIDLTSEEEAIVDYRWYWTNNMFNEYYYQEKDFANLQATLTLDGLIDYESTDNWNVKITNYTSNVKGVIETTNSNDSLSATVQYINDENNIKMSARGGLIEDYGTFNLDKNKLEGISCKIHLAKEYLSNNPEKPEIVFSDSETIVNEDVYPLQIEFEKYKGLDELLKTLSITLNKLIDPNSTIGTTNELWNNPDIYTNAFSLTYNKSNTTYEDSIHYIQYNGEYTQEKENDPKVTTMCVNSTLKDAELGFKMDFSGIYFSKYYYLTKKEDKVGKLRPFILTESDLQNYNIQYQNSSFYFDKALAVSVRNRQGCNSMITGGIIKFNSPTQGTPEELERANIKGDDDCGGGGNEDIPISVFTNKHSSAIIDNFNFLFPVVIAGFFSGSDHLNESYKMDTNFKISNNKSLTDEQQMTFSNSDLGGTLAGISSNMEIQLGDHYISKNTSCNVLTRFIPYVMSYLTQFYYVDDTPYSVDVPSNYIYLSPNSIEYTRDIVLELTTSSDNPSQLILFKHYMSLYDYVNQVITKCSKTTASHTDKNVNIELKSCQKNCPITCKFNYIPPSMLYSMNNQIMIESCFEQVPSLLIGDFIPQKNVVYGWDFKTNQFKNSKEIYEMNISTYSLDTDNNIKGVISNTYNTINKQSKEFIVDSSYKLQLRNIPGQYTQTYRLATADRASGANGGVCAISQLKTGLKYY